MIARVFHLWERRLASAAEDRVVRPFEWGCEWIDAHGDTGEDAERLRLRLSDVVVDISKA